MAKKILITAGPTFEPIDPVRFIGNRSSGKQGIAIAKAFAEKDCEVHLVIGPVESRLLENLPKNIQISKVRTAREMLAESLKYIDCDIAVHCAAVSDFRPKEVFKEKVKKGSGISLNDIEFVENPDILATFSQHKKRPKIVIGFAAETTNLIENAKKKIAKKGCDYIMANNVSGGKVFGEDENKVFMIGKDSVEEWEKMSKEDVGKKLAERFL